MKVIVILHRWKLSMHHWRHSLLPQAFPHASYQVLILSVVLQTCWSCIWLQNNFFYIIGRILRSLSSWYFDDLRTFSGSIFLCFRGLFAYASTFYVSLQEKYDKTNQNGNIMWPKPTFMKWNKINVTKIILDIFWKKPGGSRLNTSMKQKVWPVLLPSPSQAGLGW